MEPRLIIVDIDNVLNDLVMTTLKIMGLEDKFNLKARYYLNECLDVFTEEQNNMMDKLWENGDTYLMCQVEPGIEKLNEIMLVENTDLKIHSFCAGEDAARAKRLFVKSNTNLTDEHLVLEIYNKTPFNKAFAIVEDHFQYLCTTDAEYKLLVNKPYNKAEEYGTTDKEQNIIRFNTTDEALQFVLDIL